MEITTSYPKNKTEVRQYYSLVQKILDLKTSHPRKLEFYLEVFKNNPQYLISAKNKDKLVGVLLSCDENIDTILIGELGVDPNYRNKGVGTILLSKLEEIAIKKNKKQILLGAKEKAEKFYLKKGFIPMLFVQLEGNNKLDILKKIHNQNISWENTGDGFSKIIIETKSIDKVLEKRFMNITKAHTQYLFTKKL